MDLIRLQLDYVVVIWYIVYVGFTYVYVLLKSVKFVVITLSEVLKRELFIFC
jgi:hypothetical protein